MRQVNIRKLRKGLASELKDLPFEIVRSGVVVGVVDYPVRIVSTVANSGNYVGGVPVKWVGVEEARQKYEKTYCVDGKRPEPVHVYFNPRPKGTK